MIVSENMAKWLVLGGLAAFFGWAATGTKVDQSIARGPGPRRQDLYDAERAYNAVMDEIKMDRIRRGLER